LKTTVRPIRSGKRCLSFAKTGAALVPLTIARAREFIVLPIAMLGRI
jgi:hypothetical protein